jgi:regulator of sirC expression with transglutaminase-like and TPR domain
VHDGSPFLAFARLQRPDLDALLLALAGHFRPVDRYHARACLDDLSRHLFGLCGLHPEAQAGCVLHALRNEIGLQPADCDDPDHLMLDRVLDGRRGHPLLLSIVAVELARRAGVRATICSSPAHWYVAFGEQDVVLVDVAAVAPSHAEPAPLQRHCAHEVAFRVLSRLCHAYTASARPREARRAARLLRALDAPAC